jgi:branched-subunit amino acid transport protein
MRMHSGIYIYIYIFVMAFSTWLMRVAASLVMKKPIENRFFQSFLYYVPYVTLAVMTFPAIVEATQSPVAGAAALIAGILAAWYGASLLKVAVICCVTVFILESFL